MTATALPRLGAAAHASVCNDFVNVANALGTRDALCIFKHVPMNRTSKHLRSYAGTSITKAVAQRCAQMRPATCQHWSKSQFGAGSQA
jgi:hypothetical protein